MTNKTTEALKLAEEALESVHGLSGINMSKPLAAIREALAEQEKQEPVAWVSEDVCEGQYIDGRTRKIWWECKEGIGMAIYAAPVSAKMQGDCTLAESKCNPHPDAPHGFNRNASHNADRYVCDCEGWEPEEPVKRPQNCGTGYCSCIECVMEPVSIPDHITCPFCESDHVPDWLHDLKLDAKAIRAEALEEAAKHYDTFSGDCYPEMVSTDDVSAAIRRLK